MAGLNAKEGSTFLPKPQGGPHTFLCIRSAIAPPYVPQYNPPPYSYLVQKRVLSWHAF